MKIIIVSGASFQIFRSAMQNAIEFNVCMYEEGKKNFHDISRIEIVDVFEFFSSW